MLFPSIRDLLGLGRTRKRSSRKAPTRKQNSVQLRLEQLEGRVVPSTTPLDLTVAGSSGFINGALFRDITTSPTGSGRIHSFVRVQATGQEQGYNTSYRPLEFDENSSPRFTTDLKLNEVPVVNIG